MLPSLCATCLWPFSEPRTLLRSDRQDYFEEGLADAEVVETLCSQQFEVSLASVDPKQEQVKKIYTSGPMRHISLFS